MALVAEAPGYIQVFSDGSVKRFAPDIIAPSVNPTHGFMSKDVVIDSSKPITGRVFVPENISSKNAVPVLVYFHGGGFSIGSTTWSGYHYFLGGLSVTCKCVILSVDYRLAPEYKLPIAYEDCYSSLAWLCNAVSHEPWLQKADLSRVFLSGDSAGGNIAHHVAVKAIRDKACPIRVKGILPVHPYFGSEKRTKLEQETGDVGEVAMNDFFWGLSLPEGSNRDFYGCNFENGDLSKDEWARFPAVVVYVGGLDFLKERGVMYVEFLQKRIKGVKLVEAEEDTHVYHIFYPDSDASHLLQGLMNTKKQHKHKTNRGDYTTALAVDSTNLKRHRLGLDIYDYQ
ncbi:hypothetical protein ACET3Z_019816 [Daucus carota]